MSKLGPRIPIHNKSPVRHGRPMTGNAVGVYQVGSCGLNLNQREALDEIGVIYTNGGIPLEIAMVYGRWVRAGNWQAALAAARRRAVFGKAA